MKRLTEDQVRHALEQNNGRSSRAAHFLGVDERTIQRWKKKLGIPAGDTPGSREDLVEYRPGNIYPVNDGKPFIPVNVEPQAAIPIAIEVPSGPHLKRVFVFSDIQGKDYSPVAFSIALKRCKEYQPTHVVIIGDFQDNTALRGKEGKRIISIDSEELADLQEEQALCNKLLDAIDAACPEGCKKYYVKGNHEDRADKIVGTVNGKSWAPLLLAENVLRLRERKWEWCQYNECVTLGKLKYTHGAFYDMHHAYHHARVYCENVVYGHTHQVQVFNMPTPARTLSFQAISVGCLANVNPDWQRNKPNAHDHAFLEVNYLPTGEFFPALRRIINGKLLVGDILYKA